MTLIKQPGQFRTAATSFLKRLSRAQQQCFITSPHQHIIQCNNISSFHIPLHTTIWAPWTSYLPITNKWNHLSMISYPQQTQMTFFLKTHFKTQIVQTSTVITINTTAWMVKLTYSRNSRWMLHKIVQCWIVVQVAAVERICQYYMSGIWIIKSVLMSGSVYCLRISGNIAKR